MIKNWPELQCVNCEQLFSLEEGVLKFKGELPPEVRAELEGIKQFDEDSKADSRNQNYRTALLKLPGLTTNNDLVRPNSYFWKVSIGEAGFNKAVREIGHVPKKVLELGADWCWASNHLAQRGHNVIALDINLDHLQQAKKIYPGNFRAIQHDMNSLPFKDKSFEVVIVVAALHHSTDIFKTIAEIARVLKPSGQLIMLREPVRGSFVSEEQFGVAEKEVGIHETSPLYAEWIAALERAGFKQRNQIAKLNFSKGGYNFRNWLRATKRQILALPIIGPLLRQFTITDMDFYALKLK